MNGELSLTAAGGHMRQNDQLIAPINCPGVFGIDQDGSGLVGPGNPFLYSCADWNTPAALSRTTADMSIDTTLVNARVVVQPSNAFSVRGGEFNREDYRNTYVAFNPLTGQYGYVSENGSRGSIVPGGVGIWDPVGAPSAENTRHRERPRDTQTIEANAGGDWRLSELQYARNHLQLQLATNPPTANASRG